MIAKTGGEMVERRGNTLHGLRDFRTENGSRQGQKLALTVLCVPHSLDGVECREASHPRDPGHGHLHECGKNKTDKATHKTAKATNTTVKASHRPRDPRHQHLHVAQNNYFTEMCSGSEAGSYLKLI